MKKIVFLGASTAFFEVSEIINAINEKELQYEIIAILDDNEGTHGQILRGVPVVGSLELVKNYSDVSFVFGIGSMKTRLIRQRILNRLNIETEKFETIIHPSAIIDRTALIGNGCIIHCGVCIGNDVVISPFTVIAVNSAIGPYVFIESFAMIASLVVILSGAYIGKAAFIGSSSCVTEYIKVGKGSMIGAGSIVNRNIEPGSFFLGNPGKILSKIELPDDLN